MSNLIFPIIILELRVTSDTWNKYANGYLASCESNLLSITVDKIYSSTAQITVALPKKLLRSSESTEQLRRPFLYIYYKITQTRNETHFDAGRSRDWLKMVEKVNYNSAPYGKYR